MNDERIGSRRPVFRIGIAGALTSLAVLWAPSPSLATLPGEAFRDRHECQATTGDTFESPTVPENEFLTLFPGQMIGPWTVTQEAVDLIGKGFWQAADGVQSLDLNHISAGGVERTFDTDTLPLPLFTYIISYCLAGNPDGGPAVKTGQVLVDGSVVEEFSFDITETSRSDMGYRPERFSLSPSGPSAKVEFVSTSPGAFGPVIDKVTFKKCLLGVLCSLAR